LAGILLYFAGKYKELAGKSSFMTGKSTMLADKIQNRPLFFQPRGEKEWQMHINRPE
jgi:hypothetical protein